MLGELDFEQGPEPAADLTGFGGIGQGVDQILAAAVPDFVFDPPAVTLEPESGGTDLVKAIHCGGLARSWSKRPVPRTASLNATRAEHFAR